jgi:hypothetical protein
VTRPTIIAVVLALPSVAFAGSLDGEVGFDVLTAGSKSTETASGPAEKLHSTELGMTVRADLAELDDRLGVHLDYRGVEPVGGAFRDQRHRLLYAANLAFGVVPDKLTLTLGRFVAPSVTFTPVDGLRADVHVEHATISAYGGRRGVTSSRQDLGLDDLLPAAGLAFDRVVPKLQITALGGWSKDRAWGTTSALDYSAAQGLARVGWQPRPELSLGGQAALATHASYTIDPYADVASEPVVALEAEALGLWNAALWAGIRPNDALHFDADVDHQVVGVYRAGVLDADGNLDEAAVQNPNFTDARLRAAWAPRTASWLRADVRYRVRPDRTELRWGGSFDVQDLGAPGTRLGGGLFADSITKLGDVAYSSAIDRLLWTAETGYRGEGIDSSLGVTFVERAAGPVSARNASASEGVDLAPFTLDTEDILFFRGFQTTRHSFVGLDVEKNLHDAEWRVMFQVGGLGDFKW